MLLRVLLLWLHCVSLTCQRPDSIATENLSLTDSDLPAGHSRRRPRYALATSLISCSQPERGSSRCITQLCNHYQSLHSSYVVKFVTPDFVWWYSQALRPEAGVVSQESRAEWDEEEAPERDAVRCADRSSNKLPALHARDAHTYISLTMVFHMRRLDENTS